jgi:cytochrome oxidase Cu insertion factor (SCO1/SenC/PrrC family)
MTHQATRVSFLPNGRYSIWVSLGLVCPVVVCLVVACLVVACLGMVSGCAERPQVGVGEPEPDLEFAAAVDPAAPFTLTDQDGQEFSSESLAGKVWLGAVFFSNCPGPCFRENQAIADILREIDDPDFIAVSLTCDPETDTPEVLGRYADRFTADTARWKFLTGDMAVIQRVGTKKFLLPTELGVHAEKGVVFDREGRLRGGYSLTDANRVELLKKLIREVLADEHPAEPAAGEKEPAPASEARAEGDAA